MAHRIHAPLVTVRSEARSDSVHDVTAAQAIDLDEILQLAVAVAALGAEAHREGRRTLLRVSQKASPFDLVTHVDREAEAAIVEGILAARPDDEILAEEGGGRAGTSGVRWIV